jgi:crotonobetainyl-CoA:carnitine CoA-transferase CaiB-like acyl-CoA transferase
MNPLDGIMVLDLTRLLPGAYATMMLGDFGADVIKIEEPGRGDPARRMSGGAYFFATNRNKRSVTIDLKAEAGRGIFLRLVEKADVVVEGFRPGVMARLGLDYERLREVNPRIVYCAITGYGQDGPYRELAGHDLNYIAVAGVLGVNGERGRPPSIPGVQLADLAGGSLQAVTGILLALAARARTGEGQLVDVSMTDGAFALMAIPLAGYFATGRIAARGDELLSGRYACYNVYETKDGSYLALGALEEKFWANACRALGRDDLTPLQFIEGEPQREVKESLGAIFRERTREEWMSHFEGIDTCLRPVNDVAEAVADPQVSARGLIAEVADPEGGLRRRQVAPFIRLSGTPGEVRTPPPRLGEHTREVLEMLGYRPAEIEELAGHGLSEH